MPTEFCHILGGFRGFPGGLNLDFRQKKPKKIFQKKNSKKIFPKKIPKIFFQKTNKNFTAVCSLHCCPTTWLWFSLSLRILGTKQIPKKFSKKIFPKKFFQKKFSKKNFSKKKKKLHCRGVRRVLQRGSGSLLCCKSFYFNIFLHVFS